MPDLSISTNWNHKPDLDMKEWLILIKRLGLNAVELSYMITHEQLKVIKPMLKELDISVSSLHNFCPMPNDEPSPRHPSNYYRLSALDDHERNQAVKWTKICIDTAVDVGAEVVIIHAGTIEFKNDPSEHLLKLYSDGKSDSDEFVKTRKNLVELRATHKGEFVKALKNSIASVLKYAKEKNVQIGLETRYYPIEVPNFEEISYFLDYFKGEPIGYWHDVGHAEVNSRLGLRGHLDFLDTYKDQLIGVHLHGVKVLRDHLAPFEGDMDLSDKLPYFKNVIRVIEARFATDDQIKDAVGKLSDK